MKNYQKIKNNIKGIEKKDLNIFYDMDNCIALFSIKGKEEISLEKMFEKGFFSSLKPLDDGIETITKLREKGFNIFILSACISEQCRQDKITWIEKYLPTFPKENVILCDVGQNKADIIKSKGIDIKKSILIDDYGKNIKEWISARGLAIKKTFSNKKRNILTIHKHDEIVGIFEDELNIKI